jgi:multimeric flavodoxin WrbA
MNKILLINGSPRAQGNTTFLAETMAEAVRSAGGSIELVSLVTLKLKHPGCSACMGCRQPGMLGKCVLGDDLAKLVEKIPQYDVLVFAFPVYFFSPNAQIKIFLDRMFCLFDTKNNISLLPRVKLAILATAAGSLAGGLEASDNFFLNLAKYIRIPYTSFLRPLCSEDFSRLKNDKKSIEEISNFGRHLAQW